MQRSILRCWLQCGAVLFLLAGAAQGARYAVLAGVSKYQSGGGKFDLDGPASDVAALRQKLVSDLGYAPADVQVLINDQATQQGFLDAVATAVAKAKKGDYLFIYFSGHGTSSFDKHVPGLGPGIGPNTGALVPYDAPFTSADALLQKLIIGRRDLRPRLLKLDPGAEALVVLDACYSGDTAKAIVADPGGRPKFIEWNAPGESQRGLPSLQAAEAELLSTPTPPAEERYPYENVLSISAASKFQAALDISSSDINTGRRKTVDGKPHGAMTNSLLLGMSGAADTNHDGSVSHQELFQYVREHVESEFPHTPQLQAPPDRDLTATTAFGLKTRPARPAAPPLPVVSIKLENVPDSLQAQIKGLDRIRLATDTYDLLLRGEGANYALYHGSRSLIHMYQANETAALVKRISGQPLANDLLDLTYAGQDFNAQLDLKPEGQGTFMDGQELQFSARVEKPAFLLLLDIDSGGTVSVLYPTNGAKTADPGKRIEMGGGKVGAPYGMEYVKLFAFREKPRDFEYWRCREPKPGTSECREFEPGDADFTRLMKMLRESDNGRAAAKVKVVTRP